MDAQESQAARRIVRAALKAGYLVSVNDGEETTLHRSASFTQITDAMATTDEDTLILHREGSPTTAFLFLVYGNGAEDLVCDHTDAEEIAQIAAA